MRTAIFNLCIGNQHHWHSCLQAQSIYCKKYGIDHIAIQDFKIKFPHVEPHNQIYFEKFQALYYLLQDKYDMIAILDADIMPTPQAPDIFNFYSEPNTFYAFDENKLSGITEVSSIPEGTIQKEYDIMDRNPYIEATQPDYKWNLNDQGRLIYYNVGVMLFDQEAGKNIFDSFLSVANYPYISYMFPEQTYLNALLQKNNIPTQSIEHIWNRMDLGKNDPDNERHKANFIHYAGPCRYGPDVSYSYQKKVTVISNDYRSLYQ
jgi:hypothetical protein